MKPVLRLLTPSAVSPPCRLQKREKRKEEEQRRKQWVDEEREKTLSRLRSFREVRLAGCAPRDLPTAASSANKTPETPRSPPHPPALCTLNSAAFKSKFTR